jgi:hypothetical protein
MFFSIIYVRVELYAVLTAHSTFCTFFNHFEKLHIPIKSKMSPPYHNTRSTTRAYKAMSAVATASVTHPVPSNPTDDDVAPLPSSVVPAPATASPLPPSPFVPILPKPTVVTGMSESDEALLDPLDPSVLPTPIVTPSENTCASPYPFALIMK